jgi:hypothetical protein
MIVASAGPGGVFSTAVDVVSIQLKLFNSTRVIKGDIFSLGPVATDASS